MPWLKYLRELCNKKQDVQPQDLNELFSLSVCYTACLPKEIYSVVQCTTLTVSYLPHQTQKEMDRTELQSHANHTQTHNHVHTHTCTFNTSSHYRLRLFVQMHFSKSPLAFHPSFIFNIDALLSPSSYCLTTRSRGLKVIVLILS